ncbi:hypothetical protein ABTE25_20400, partial [Acinetobacter baumannii]
GLISLDFAVVANFGQSPVKTSEPCGKRGFVGRRWTSTRFIVGVPGQGRTLDDAAPDGNYAATLKSRADHTDRVMASQDCVI